ncbi:MAG: NADH-quinone oxidoreductase subunit NuoE [Rickettsiaceae bacterium]
MKKTADTFSFNKDNALKAKEIIAKYPEGRQRSAMLPLLDLAQRQNGGWLSNAAIEYVASFISEPFMRAYEVASFYTMFNLKPVGKYHIQVCGTTPCWLKGAHDVMKGFEEHTKTKCGKTSEDGVFTISEVECLGACRNAPVVQINDDFYEDLDDKKVVELVETLRKRSAK